MSAENMKRRIQVNSSTLEVGDKFYFAGHEGTCYHLIYRIIAQGPEVFGYVELGYDANSVYTDIITHKDVWIERPRTTVGEFGVGEKFRRQYTSTLKTGPNDRVFLVTAIGKKNSLAMPSEEEDGYEYRFSHEDECEEVFDDNEVCMSDDIDYSALDDGVREIVRKLRSRGFNTTDSGDGSKASHMEGALPFPHVMIVMGSASHFSEFIEDHDPLSEARYLKDYVLPYDWEVEVSWSTADEVVTLFAFHRAAADEEQ